MELSIPIEDAARRGELYGNSDCNLRLIRSAFDVRVSARDNVVHLSGEADAVQRAALVVQELQKALRHRPDLPDDMVQQFIEQSRHENDTTQDAHTLEVFLASASIIPKGAGQQKYVNSIFGNDLTFCTGPAGTGKTFLAVAAAVSLLRKQKVKRIMLVRPAVEAGEKLGYLPGDLQAKVNPYLRPLFDAMNDMMSYDQLRRFMQNDIIEVVPLAFMRGRTLNHAAIILDEAQNATIAQMLMFLTRLGQRSKMIVTGDESQSDLTENEPSGFIDATQRLAKVDGVGIVHLTQADIVRHPLVQRVVEAYGRNGTKVP